MYHFVRAAALTVATLVASNATAVELLTNGDFETGALTGWTVTDLAGGSGTFLASANDGSAPPFPGGSGGATAINPGGGTTYAVSDQGGPGAHALTQAFVTPGAFSSITFSFDQFMNDFSGGSNPTVDPGGLDHTVLATNQHARVDILTGGAHPLSTAPADIVLAVLVPVPAAGAGPNPWISSPLFELAPILAPLTSYQVRFAEADNSGFLNLGVDNVSVFATAVPAPAALPLLLGGIALLGFAARRRG